MKYYSEKLNEMFDSLEELEVAEKAVASKRKKKAPVEEKPVENTEVATRKQLAADVDAADEKVRTAYADYETAKARAEELSKEYLAAVEAILEPARKAVKDAEKARYESIKTFNENFGAYQVTYTGARAADEMVKAINNINARANKMFRDMFWI